MACCKAYLHDLFAMHIGERIRRRRERLGLTQDQIGEALGVSRETVSQWESGTTEPRPARYPLLCQTLRCNLKWLLAGEGTEEADPELTERERAHLSDYRRVAAAKQDTIDLITRQLANQDDQSTAQGGR